MGINLGSQPAFYTTANPVYMPPNSSTKVIPVSGGRHTMRCANADGLSGKSGVVGARERIISSHRQTSSRELRQGGMKSLEWRTNVSLSAICSEFSALLINANDSSNNAEL